MSRVAVDAGGTFTDVAVLDADGVLSSYKVLSHPQDPAAGLLAAVEASVALDDVTSLVNGTTAGLNAVLARRGTRVLVITTDGFRDVLPLARAQRTDIWQLKYRRPGALVDHGDICTVRERVLADGTVETPLDLGGLDAISERVDADGILSVAVCLLHSTSNPVHELEVRAALLGRHPALHVSVSHEIAPEIGEYERFSSTVVNAYVATTVGDYLARAQEGLRARSYDRPLLVMRSSGGVTSARSARARPIQTMLSGPAGGVVGAEVLARRLGLDRVLALDMGGTSLDASVIVDRRMTSSSALEIDGLPIRMPVVDLITVSAGGGSVAWVQGRSLRVGPQSAGASPGPACYGFGGTQPTVTDANLVLGRLGHGGIADDAIALHVDDARAAFAPLAEELGLTIEAIAESVVAVTDARMADALRTITVQRGHDPRDFAILAFGGAGPLHAASLAEELGIAEVVVPPAPGVFSAWGMLHAPVRHDLSEPLLRETADLDAADLAGAHGRLMTRARAALVDDDVDPATARYVAGADMRYSGQQFTVTVECPVGADVATWDAEFRAVYGRTHGQIAGRASTELVNVRLSAFGPTPAPVTRTAGARRAPEPPRYGDVYADGVAHRARICTRDGLGAEPLHGPAVVCDPGSTVHVPPGWSAQAGPLDTIRLVRRTP
jgi:N-methylhydantoinase A